MEGIIKYCICYLVEKEHRFVFDNCYISYDDPKYRPLTISQKIRLWLFNNLWFNLYRDYRPFLRKWHEDKKKCYLRYIPYEIK